MNIVTPELGLDPSDEVMLSCWLASVGDEVVEGDRLVELLNGEMTFDVSSPATGRLARIFVEPDEPAGPGTVLGQIEPE